MRAGLESVCLRLAAIVDLMIGDDGSGDNSDKGSSDGETVATEGTTPRASSTGAAHLMRCKDAGVITSGNALAASPLWRQLLADALGRTVRVSGVAEETSVGVAVLLSSLEGVASRQREAGGGRGSTGEASDGVGVSGAAAAAPPEEVHTPDDAACRVYREAGLAQNRAYDAIFGTGGGGPADAPSPRGV